MSEWKQENRSLLIEQPRPCPDSFSISLKTAEEPTKIRNTVNFDGKND